MPIDVHGTDRDKQSIVDRDFTCAVAARNGAWFRAATIACRDHNRDASRPCLLHSFDPDGSVINFQTQADRLRG